MTKENWFLLISRVFLSHIFILSGLNKIGGFAGTKQYMMGYAPFNAMAEPLVSLFAVGAIFLEVVGGILLLLGFKTKIGAIMLIIFLIPTTLIFHTEFSERIQMIMFMKNLAILGGILAIVAHGAGKISIDGRR